MQTQERNMKLKNSVAREKSLVARYRQQILRQAGYLLSIDLQHQRPPRRTALQSAQMKADIVIRGQK
jgi:hypothetical protein